jgi:DNA uptake protein ComE-like DNA-binding protein
MHVRSIRLSVRQSVQSLLVPSALAGAMALAACSSQASSSTAPAAAPTTFSAAAPTPSAATSAGTPAASAAQRVNANTASQEEVAQALAAGGVPNAARWAREVVEYRPYPTDDPSFAKLRQELAKYNPTPDVVDKIVASLTL